VGPVPWRLPRQSCCLTSYTSAHSISTHTVPPGRTPMPSRTVQIQGCHVAELRQVWRKCLRAFLANVVAWHDTHATTLSVFTLCHLEERQRHHTPCKCKVVMLLSFARCGPSALAPSSPILVPGMTHTQPHYQCSHCATWKNANGTTHIANTRLSCC